MSNQLGFPILFIVFGFCLTGCPNFLQILSLIDKSLTNGLRVSVVETGIASPSQTGQPVQKSQWEDFLQTLNQEGNKKPVKSPPSQSLSPYYKSCEDVDLSAQAEQEQTQATFCFECSPELGSTFKDLTESFKQLSVWDHQKKTERLKALKNRKDFLNQRDVDFKQRLQNRIIGQLAFKLTQAELLKGCVSGDPDWLKKRNSQNSRTFNLFFNRVEGDHPSQANIRADYLTEAFFRVMDSFHNDPSEEWFGISNLNTRARGTDRTKKLGNSPFKKLSPQDCEEITTKFKSTVYNHWSDMRVHLALSRPQLRDDKIFFYRNTWFDQKPRPYTLGVKAQPKLSPDEVQKAEEQYIAHLSQVPLRGVSALELQNLFKDENSVYSDDASLTFRLSQNGNWQKLKKAERELRQKSEKQYERILENHPILGYITSANPSKEELKQAISGIQNDLEGLLTKIQDENVDMALLLSFEPLLEDLLQENKDYCLIAERAKYQLEQSQELQDQVMLALGGLATVPCLVSLGTACLFAGLTLGAVSVHQEYKSATNSFSRFLTSKDFERLGTVIKKNKQLGFAILNLGTNFMPSPTLIHLK